MGAYFCFFAKEKLPTYYDQNRVCTYKDGVFELNLPCLSFNNTNWGKILKVGRIWAVTLMMIYPVISFITTSLISGVWQIVVELFITDIDELTKLLSKTKVDSISESDLVALREAISRVRNSGANVCSIAGEILDEE